MERKEQCRRFDVFTIQEYTHEKQVKSQWTRVGAAFENIDGSWNLRLHALPVTNPKSGLAELHMREPWPKDTATEAKEFDSFTYSSMDAQKLF